MVLVTDQTLVIVFRCHGIVRSESANPPQTSTTGSPSTKTATEAPASPSSSDPASTFGTAVNRSSYDPWISAMRRISAHWPVRGNRNSSPGSWRQIPRGGDDWGAAGCEAGSAVADASSATGLPDL